MVEGEICDNNIPNGDVLNLCDDEADDEEGFGNEDENGDGFIMISGNNIKGECKLDYEYLLPKCLE